MGLFNSIRLGSSAAGDYEIERSLRFNDDDNAHLSRTPSSASNRKTWTISAWVKRGNLGSSNKTLFNAYDGSSSRRFRLFFGSNDQIEYNQGGNANSGIGASTAKFRDINAWYHFVFVADYTNATAADRFKVYVNGSEISMSFSDDVENADGQWNGNWEHDIGIIGSSTGPFDGYMAEINVIDGTALTPSSFAETDAVTGEYKPKKYAGSYGTSGFYLNFSDNSGTTATTLGKDSSGNGNNFTPNNFSVSAGAGNDSVEDTPTNNFCTLNPLSLGNTFSNGNLDHVTGTSSGRRFLSSFGVSSGKWYWETTVNNLAAGLLIGIGDTTDYSNGNTFLGNSSGVYGWYSFSSTSLKYYNGSNTSYGTAFTASQTIGLALDLDSGTLTFYANDGSSVGVLQSSLPSATYYPVFGDGSASNTSSVSVNFGQRAFTHNIPTGHKPLNSANLPDPSIAFPNKHFGTLLYTGNATSRSITGLNFQPDWVWIKNRSNAYHHGLFDAVRGANKVLKSSDTSAEGTFTQQLMSFNSDGYTLGDNSDSGNYVNINGHTYVGWNWKGGGTASSNSNGSITSSVSANTSAGFSIVSYTGTGSNATIGHGLGVAPQAYIIKRRDSGSGNTNWRVYHHKLNGGSNPEQYHLILNATNSESGQSNIFNDTAPTSTVFSIGTHASTGENSGTYIAYCFSEVAGYSKAGSYTGNGSSDGTFVFTGFRPAFVLVKRSDSTADWTIFDAVRSSYNVVDDYIVANTSEAEYTSHSTVKLDFTSNGFKVRGTWQGMNGSGSSIIYLAFAETPFKYARAR